MTAGPLNGVRVIELGGIGPSAFAGLLLADLGAEVIRIDRPGTVGNDFMPATDDLLNRGKRSVLIDLKRPEGVDAVLALGEGAAALTEGYRPGVAERLGLGPADLHARNPALVYARVTGWGQTGPLAQTAGHDIGYIALTGALHAIGDAGGPPQVPLSLVGDFGGGATYVVMGILAAIIEAQRTGRGQVIDGAIVDGASHLLMPMRAMLPKGLWTDERGVNLFDGGSPFYSVYETADRKHIAVGPVEPRFFATLVEALGVEIDLSRQYDRSTWPAMRAQLAAAFRTRTRDEWDALLRDTDACAAPVLSITEAGEHPHLVARGTLIEVDGVVQPAPAPRFSGYADPVPPLPPAPGADTRDVLAGVGLAGLIDAGVAAEASP